MGGGDPVGGRWNQFPNSLIRREMRKAEQAVVRAKIDAWAASAPPPDAGPDRLEWRVSDGPLSKRHTATIGPWELRVFGRGGWSVSRQGDPDQYANATGFEASIEDAKWRAFVVYSAMSAEQE